MTRSAVSDSQETSAANMAEGFLTRNFSESEIANDSPNTANTIVVIEPSEKLSFAQLQTSFSEHADVIRSKLAENGAVLLRGFSIADTTQAEQLLQTLGTEFDDEYLGGASPRSRLSEHFFTSTEAPAPYVITFHTEMCYLPQRPGKIFFYCIQEPKKYGETPVFDCAAIYQALEPELRAKIERLGLIYRRYFVSKKASSNVYKTWMDAFNAETREEVAEACAKQGMTMAWQDDGGLITETKMPGVMTHPETGTKCLSLTLYNTHAAPYDMQQFKHRINSVVRFALSKYVKFHYARPNVFMRTLWGDGSDISKTETEAIINAAWKSSTLFNWQQGDLLLIDNVRCGHGRLNVVKPRKIAAALGDPYTLSE